MAVQVRESKHPYDNNTKFEVSPTPNWFQFMEFISTRLPSSLQLWHFFTHNPKDFLYEILFDFSLLGEIRFDQRLNDQKLFVCVSLTLYCVSLFFPPQQDKVHIPGAIYLSIKFDSHCNTEEGCDEVTMSSSSDFLHDVHNFSGSPMKWSDFEIPGEEIFDTDKPFLLPSSFCLI